MKKIFNKTAGVIIAVSMLCAIMATGCTASDNGDNTATENKTAVLNSEPQQVDPFTIKVGPYQYVKDLGITVETTNSNHICIESYDYTESTIDIDIKDENIKDIYGILMCYDVNEPDENGVFEYSETELDQKVKVSIPYDEGMYLLNFVDGVTYDVPTEYVDGSYVFETDKLGTFMFSTKSTGKTQPAKTENVELAQQTIVDDVTGVQVSGMLPVDAEMNVVLCAYGDHRVHDSSKFYFDSFEENYPKVTDISELLCSDEFERSFEADSGRLSGLLSEEGWTNIIDPQAQGKLELKITFIKDYEMLDFESDLTVTLPFDYREALIKGSRIGTASAMQYDYTNKEFVTLELVDKEATAEGAFQFKAKTPGQFFIGDDIALNSMVEYYATGNIEVLGL
ncbi:MAG: hypothetical protein UE295_05530 [Acutalibacteraceae bacterium]|nr:hypothetical protein [Acutalibacteraceae bacterium]